MNKDWFVLLVLLPPLLAFLLMVAGRRILSKRMTSLFGVLSTGISLVFSLVLLVSSLRSGVSLPDWEFTWLTLDKKPIQFGVTLQPLNVLMLVIVSLVSFLVHIYSSGYMKDDERFTVFYSYLALFTFSMLGLVISPNLLQIYIFWELVGVCSFLLVGFWYFKPEAKRAAQKAFIVTRIGDIGLFIAIAMIFAKIGSFELHDLKGAIEAGKLSSGMITLFAILIFIGAVGKSGQFPLHTWLPDAMEGPTPVSALIHAATMVAAGVYLVANTFWLFQASSVAMDVIAYVGGFTAIFAATIGIAQTDIKRILAYSTVSQLGYMMLALGSVGYVAGVFHLMTHAFFKALLFLAAGAVIVSLHHEQDIRKMGGLWKKNKGLGWLFLIGCLSIAGIPPFSGFFSKDEILLSVYANGRYGLFIVGVIAAFLTAFYMFRLFFKVFAGSHEPKTARVPWSMTGPMIVLAILSAVAGFIQFPTHFLETWLITGGMKSLHGPESIAWIPVLAVIVSLLGISLAYLMYGVNKWDSRRVAQAVPWLHQCLVRKYYVDEMYHSLIVLPLKGFGWLLQVWDRYVIDGLVQLCGWISMRVGKIGSTLQNGQAQTYALISVVSFVILIVSLLAGRLFG
ncbi:NADH-quinone oxidoreductase subunit L [Thermoflavimicrobium dichotomicum]|uniref:NADH-quinone oxidoreductase subunit L n=1 Tax=Thermoflavimicrobium dichotomicum TaxID=46223 RepID=A0A1I3K141_9BACL|nr:NADH-quinone oxidoreductase subunit L [Thermoflavimicrobium dichotomicum]SFI66163.1 NADH-quinone oxidoreductase subunit L [Thermoflavimicrobium dichotomicum]